MLGCDAPGNRASALAELRQYLQVPDNGLHYVTFAEDASRGRTRSGPRIMASLPVD